MSDNYEFEKSSQPQDTGDYSPYVDKQYNGFINDLNSSVYTNTSLTLVQFDLGQIYNSQKFTNTNDLFMVVPITMVAAFSTANNAALNDPNGGSVNLLSLKSNFIHLIHQADLQINGKTIESTQPFINVAKHFQMLSEMSVNDLQTMGHTLGFGETIDNPRSVVWNGNGTTASGNGLTNNRPFAGNGSRNPYTLSTSHNSSAVNDALASKLGRYVDTANTGGNNKIFANIYTEQQLNNELKPLYKVVNKYMIWYDYAVIKLSNLFESLENIGLVRKFDCTLRIWFNTGTINAAISSPDTATPGYSLTTANNTFTNTCPFTINYLNANNAGGGIPATTAFITAGLYISKSPTTSFGAVNFANVGSSPLQACRIYYSQIQVDPAKATLYVDQNRNKKVVYRTVLTNQYNAIGSSGAFNQLINSGIVHPVGLLVIPFISSTVTGFGDFQWKSPFDSCPATSSPVSLTNFQVSVGGVNQLQSTLNYTYENFVEQINLCESLTSSDFGVSCGLYSQAYWEMFRHYYVNIERSPLTDKNVARNINISFTNNSSVAIDILVFTIYSDEFVIDVESGLVTK